MKVNKCRRQLLLACFIRAEAQATALAAQARFLQRADTKHTIYPQDELRSDTAVILLIIIVGTMHHLVEKVQSDAVRKKCTGKEKCLESKLEDPYH